MRTIKLLLLGAISSPIYDYNNVGLSIFSLGSINMSELISYVLIFATFIFALFDSKIMDFFGIRSYFERTSLVSKY